MLRSALLSSRRYFAGLTLACIAAIVTLANPAAPPVSAKADRKLEGAEIFASSGCTHCHGPDGQGTDNGPSLRNVRKRLKPAQIHNQIINGGKQMPAFGDTLTTDQVQSLIAFLRARNWISVPAQPVTPPAQPCP